eukprot:CAMPEP_0179890986 /NCGR_PEP_ID=MMETSP0982-20121206/33428_1 /TAXON_ID=483367 /ORGANISM="non described non described, Strain CCMP 2436" /LENGTH=78 /DNA_ID=CAMNT_0021787313 /DNA_START=47 /DNA_END=283 /DNA_ORIENTATION=-
MTSILACSTAKRVAGARSRMRPIQPGLELVRRVQPARQHTRPWGPPAGRLQEARERPGLRAWRNDQYVSELLVKRNRA